MNNLDQLLDGYKNSCDIYRYIDLRLLSNENGVFRCKVPLSKQTKNHVNMMHASVLFAIGELLGGMVCSQHIAKPEKFQPVVRDFKVDFRAPAFTDVTAEAFFDAAQAEEMNKQLEKNGRFDFPLAAKLTDDNGQLVAETLGSYAIRNFMGG